MPSPSKATRHRTGAPAHARRRRACSPAGPRSAAPESRAGATDSRPAPMLDPALDAVAAADIDVVMHAHRRWPASSARRAIWSAYLGIWIEAQTSSISRQGSQLREHAEGLDRHGRAARPFHAQLQMMRAGGEILFDLAPDECLVEQHVGAVRLVHQRRAFSYASSASSTKGSGSYSTFTFSAASSASARLSATTAATHSPA